MSAGDELKSDLSKALPAQSLIFEREDARPFESDWRGLVSNSAEAVLLPADTEEVARIVRICAHHRVAIVPQGGNTSLVAGAVPIPNRRQVILNLRRMRTVRSLDRTNGTMTVEAGLTLAEAKAAADAEGLLLPVGLASEGSCQVGGNLATNAGGVQALSYGSMRSHVLGIEAVLPDGRIWNGLRALHKDNTGIDLKQLFIGSEGIIGIITAATLRLHHKPNRFATAIIALDSLDAAMTAFLRLKAAYEHDLTSCEYFTSQGMALALKPPAQNRDPFGESHDAYVLVEVTAQGADRDPAASLADALAGLFEDDIVQDAVVAQSDTQRAALWALREDISEGERTEGGSVKHDIAVPISAIPSTVRRLHADLAKLFPEARLNIFGHLGDGNLHVNVLPPAGGAPDQLARFAPEITKLIEQSAISAEGTFSAEHGIGQLRLQSLLKYRTPLELELMLTIKKALDPLWLLNPGKVLPVEEE
ncbi:MAG: FAD-binding oxidoreductase [Bauldia sp.]|uniref:FAD-binding oxidoreductase n=1 Tax=Bauldia sp. TaxID=2575872 RepID=UPI001D52701E|nr:FAD-binding oxidoreductase [Bauldia sp.]MCB1496253.1 FAD-binding oxidoreductase [Bauldia sp.]